jgi:hypothetical protein
MLHALPIPRSDTGDKFGYVFRETGCERKPAESQIELLINPAGGSSTNRHKRGFLSYPIDLKMKT